MEVLLIRNDHTVKVIGLRDEGSGSYFNDLPPGSVTARIKDRQGRDVAGETWPVDLQYIADSNGDYHGNFDDAIQLIVGRTYIVEIAADAGGGLKAFWRFKRIAQYRKPEGEDE